MLGSTLTLTMDGSGGAAKVLPLINQDGYSTEYFLDEGSVTYRANIRHLKETVKAGSLPIDRHSVTFTRFKKPTSSYPQGSMSSIQFVIRADSAHVAAETIDLSEAMAFYMVKEGLIASKLNGWES